MKDEWNNECPYDFKNIQFARYQITACPKSPSLVGQYSVGSINGITVDTDNPCYCYTFTMIDLYDGNIVDISTVQDKYVAEEVFYFKTQNNTIKEYYYINDDATNYCLILPNNVFVTNTDLVNAEFDGSNITYSEFYGYYYNTFGNECNNNTFGNSCAYNTFGNACHNNTFGDVCNNNTFGDVCNNNTFGYSYHFNTFGNSCNYNTFGNECYLNALGNDCSYNTFGNECQSNIFGNSCYLNTFGTGCNYNTFNNNCDGNTFGIYCYNNTFGNGCYYNIINNYFQYNTIGNDCRNISFTNDFVRWCTFFDGVQYVKVSVTTTNTQYLQNMQVLNGTKGTSSSSLPINSNLMPSNLPFTILIGKNGNNTLVGKVAMN